MPVTAIVYGNNADLIAEVASLHVQEGDTIADLTYGKGVFWRKCQHLDVTGSDIVTVPERPYDYRRTPYGDKAFDIAVLDPPYIHSPGNHTTDHRYQNAATTKGLLQPEIMLNYALGMIEAKRIAKRQVWVKCKDQVQGGLQRWSHCELHNIGMSVGLYARDLFILVADAQTPRGRWKVQHHARKPHSYLWVFDIPSEQLIKRLTRERVWR